MSASSDKIYPPRGFNQLPQTKKKDTVIREVDIGNRDPWVYHQAKLFGIAIPKTLSDVVRTYFYKHKLMFYRNKASRSLVACDDLNNLTENVEPNLAGVIDDIVEDVIKQYEKELKLGTPNPGEAVSLHFKNKNEL